MFAWGGPFITAIVWLSLSASGKIDALNVNCPQMQRIYIVKFYRSVRICCNRSF